MQRKNFSVGALLSGVALRDIDEVMPFFAVSLF